MTLPNTTRRREIPLTFRLRALFGGAAQFGWGIFGFGLCFVWAFVVHCEAMTFWRFIGPLRTADGVVTRSYATEAQEGDGDEDDEGVPIYAVEYTFAPPDGDDISGISYTTGTQYRPGEDVTVEYRSDHPGYSRIRGTRSAEYAWLLVFLLVFPFIGALIIVGALHYSRQVLTVLARAVPTPATLAKINKVKQSAETSHYYTYELVYELVTAGPNRRVAKFEVAKLTPAWEAYAAQRNGQKPEAILLVDPLDPKCVMLPAEHRLSLREDDHDTLIDDVRLHCVLTLIIPCLVVFGHGWLLLRHLGIL